ncbi:hypothetical protein MKW92_039833, partial [Papaver armeniacum]
FKLCKVRNVHFGSKGIPYINTFDERSIREVPDTLHIQDSTGHEFATRLANVFTIGKGTKPWISLPKGKGIKLSIIEEARKRLAAQGAATA